MLTPTMGENMRITNKRSIALNPDMPRRFVTLPQAPETASPVPWLTSLHATEGRGDFGDASYRGNCSGLIIEDLLRYYQPKTVLDPMAGSGTCPEVCRSLGITCLARDLREGFDATDERHFDELPTVDFVWLHPPYFQMIRYGASDRCLSAAASLDDFLARLKDVLQNCERILEKGGAIAILIGDGKHAGKYMGLPYRTLRIAEDLGFWLAAPEIIRFNHGSTSSTKRYTTSFIPRLHDVCFVLKRTSDL